MKKRNFNVLILFSILVIFFIAFIWAVSQTVTINPTSSEAGNYTLFNVSVSDASTSKNITQVNITNLSGPINIANLNASMYPNVSITNSGSTLIFTNLSSNYLVGNISIGYFWFNATANYVGNFSINVSTLDNSTAPGIINWTVVNVTINDTIAPSIGFIPPTPANNSISTVTYLPLNISANDSGIGVKNITVYLYNSTNLIQTNFTNFTAGNYTTFFFMNYIGLIDGQTYYANATVYDTVNNTNSTPLYTFIINTSYNPNPGGNQNPPPPTCTPKWNITTLTPCINGTQTVTLNDFYGCGVTAGQPPPTNQSCICETNWNCSAWTPAVCTNGTQTRTCTDINSCAPVDVQRRDCVVGSSVTTNASSSKTGASAFSLSSAFYAVIGIIIVSVIGVVVILMRLRKKSPSSDFGKTSNQPRFAPRGPPAGPFSSPKY